jgi:hypothetical protein
MLEMDAMRNERLTCDKSGLIISRRRTCGRGEPVSMRGPIPWVGAKSNEADGRASYLIRA